MPASPRKFAVVTTAHASGFERYGRNMVQSFIDHWPITVPLWFYSEGFQLEADPARVRDIDLLATCPELVSFKARHRDDPHANGQDSRREFRPRLTRDRKGLHLRLFRRAMGYRWDAVRFAHKSFAILHAAHHCEADVLVWVDADTRFFADVTESFLDRLAPPDCLVGCLRREGMWTETGFVTYNLRHPEMQRFLQEYEALYTQDLLFREHEYHDAFLFDVIRRRSEARGAKTYDIAQGIGRQAEHVLINSVLGSVMDHMKGDRKDGGASRSQDLIQARQESYWSDLKK